MTWIVLAVILCFKEALCQYGPGYSNPDDPRFGQNSYGGSYVDYSATPSFPKKFGQNSYGGSYVDYSATPSLPKKPFNPNAMQARPNDLYDMEEKITRAGKWPEFISKVKETGSKVEGGVMPNWEEDLYKWAAWVKSIDQPIQEPKPPKPPLVRIEETQSSEEKPSLGMEMYWGSNDKKPASPPIKRSGPEYSQTGYGGPGQSNSPPGPGYAPPPPNGMTRSMAIPITNNNVISMAQKKIEFLEKHQQYGSPNLNGIPPAGLENQNPFVAQFTQNTNNETKPSEGDLIKFAFSKLHQLENILRDREAVINKTNSNTTSDDPFSKLPKVDDFSSPIRWVPFNSVDTADGIAKVTDKETKKNKQTTINGTIYVPVVDYDLKRLGLTVTTAPTTVSPAILAMYRASTEATALRTVMDNVNIKQPDARDWLAFETILGGDNSEKMCEGNHCQARCRNLGCQTMCAGDTCGVGCVGAACNSMCKGQGCISMCIGESCISRCEGLSCDARCKGKNCQAACLKPSCFATINGKSQVSRANWNDYYQQQGGPEGHDENYNNN